MGQGPPPKLGIDSRMHVDRVDELGFGHVFQVLNEYTGGAFVPPDRPQEGASE